MWEMSYYDQAQKMAKFVNGKQGFCQREVGISLVPYPVLIASNSHVRGTPENFFDLHACNKTCWDLADFRPGFYYYPHEASKYLPPHQFAIDARKENGFPRPSGNKPGSDVCVCVGGGGGDPATKYYI